MLPTGMSGITLASHTLSPLTPMTFNSLSTTVPIAHVPHGCYTVTAMLLMISSHFSSFRNSSTVNSFSVHGHFRQMFVESLYP